MLPNIFSGSPAIWMGLVATMIALPILIHLIQRLKHRTVRWAAMDFLLKSHQRNRNWIRLKQFLLLLSRIIVLLLALAVLGQVGCRDEGVQRWLGAPTTHHYIILDDSYSMQDQSIDGVRAFDRAKSTLTKIVNRAKGRQNQALTLIRYSAAILQKSSEPTKIAQLADITDQPIDTNFDQQIESLKGQLNVSALDAGPQPALRRVAEQIQQQPDQHAVVYLLSDFRTQDWDEAPELYSLIQGLSQQNCSIELIDCAAETGINLSLEQLSPVGNVRVAQTPLMVEVAVKNHSNLPATKVKIDISSLEFPSADRRSRPTDLQPATRQLPSVFIDRIESGERVQRQLPVYFNTAGIHALVASLPDDSVAMDNQQIADLRIVPQAQVLIVDESEAGDGQFLALVLNPGGTTGLAPVIERKDYLRTASPEQLDQFDTLFLLDVDSLEASTVGKLETYVQRGGGVAFFTGPNINRDFYTRQLYRNGTGLFPLPIEAVQEIPAETDRELVDIQPDDHPIFAPALSVDNSLLDLVEINTIHRPPLQWRSSNDESSQVLATVRGMDQWPLVIEKNLGEGRVIAVLTTAGSGWNNWMRNATFVPIVLLMQDHLADGRFRQVKNLVGERVQVNIPYEQFQRSAIKVNRQPDGNIDIEELQLELQADEGSLISPEFPVLAPTLLETWLETKDNQVNVQRTAFNVASDEGNLLRSDANALISKLGDANVSFVAAQQFDPNPDSQSAASLSRLLLVLLAIVLVGEQCLAWATNYHR
jgi:hypothetical protein